MGIFQLFSRKGKGEAAPQTEEPQEELAIYSGMRVEVTTMEGRLLFVAKLLGLHDDKAELHQYSESDAFEEGESLHVRIRGYSDRDRKAVYMEGTISPQPHHTWQVEELTVARLGNDRAFFRLDTNLDATVTTFSGLNIGEKPCKLLNISVGGACIGSEYVHHHGDKFLLKVKLLEDRPASAMYCQVLRVIDRGDSKYEYGCRFLELTEEDEGKITQNIFAAQRKARAKS